MPRGIFNWTFDDVDRFLKNSGFRYNYTKGSHFFYIAYKGNQVRNVCVPFHGSSSIAPRTMNGIIRQSGLSRSDWLK